MYPPPSLTDCPFAVTVEGRDDSGPGSDSDDELGHSSTTPYVPVIHFFRQIKSNAALLEASACDAATQARSSRATPAVLCLLPPVATAAHGCGGTGRLRPRRCDGSGCPPQLLGPIADVASSLVPGVEAILVRSSWRAGATGTGPVQPGHGGWLYAVLLADSATCRRVGRVARSAGRAEGSEESLGEALLGVDTIASSERPAQHSEDAPGASLVSEPGAVLSDEPSPTSGLETLVEGLRGRSIVELLAWDGVESADRAGEAEVDTGEPVLAEDVQLTAAFEAAVLYAFLVSFVDAPWNQQSGGAPHELPLCSVCLYRLEEAQSGVPDALPPCRHDCDVAKLRRPCACGVAAALVCPVCCAAALSDAPSGLSSDELSASVSPAVPAKPSPRPVDFEVERVVRRIVTPPVSGVAKSLLYRAERNSPSLPLPALPPAFSPVSRSVPASHSLGDVSLLSESPGAALAQHRIHRILKCDACSCAEDLWICLPCGYVGCGRYQSRHALSHAATSFHVLALSIPLGRIWDYGTDSFVQRIDIDLPSVVKAGTQEDRTAGSKGGGRTDMKGLSAPHASKSSFLEREYSQLLHDMLQQHRASLNASLAAAESLGDLRCEAVATRRDSVSRELARLREVLIQRNEELRAQEEGDTTAVASSQSIKARADAELVLAQANLSATRDVDRITTTATDELARSDADMISQLQQRLQTTKDDLRDIRAFVSAQRSLRDRTDVDAAGPVVVGAGAGTPGSTVRRGSRRSKK